MMLNYKTYFFPRTKFVQILSIYIEHNSSVDFSKTVFARFWFKDRRKWTPCLIYLTKLLRIADSVKIKWKVKVGTQFCHFAKSSPYLWLELHRTKVRWRFRKFLWPSQNIWTLQNVKVLTQASIGFKWNKWQAVKNKALFWMKNELLDY